METNRIFERAKTLLRLAAFSIIVGAAGSLAAGQTLPTLTLDEVISGIAAAERSLMNVKMETELFQEERPSSTDPWKRNGVYVNSTAWYNGMPNSKVRVDVHREVLKWEQGLASHAEESYSLGFDGQFGRVVTHKSGAVNDTWDAKEAEILPDAPADLRHQWRDLSTGAAFSLNFLFNRRNKTTSEMFKIIKQADPSVMTSRERYQGADCVKISMMDGKRCYWFDLEHGYAFRGRLQTRTEKDGRKVLSESTVVTRVVEAAPGIWFPAEATQVFSWPEPDRPDIRTVFKASQVKANDPSFDEEIFTVPIPPDYLVNDTVSGVRYKGEEGLMEKLEESVLALTGGSAEIVGSPSKEPEVEVVDRPVVASETDAEGNENIPTQEDTASEDIAAQTNNRILWLVGLLAVIGSASVVVLIKRRGNAMTVLMLCILIGCIGCTAA